MRAAMVPALLLVLSSGVPVSGRSAQPAPDPALISMQKIAAEFERQVHIDGFDFTGKEPEIRIESLPPLSTFHGNIIREPRWEEISDEDRTLFNRLATYTRNEPNGKQLLEDQFYRLLVVHELGHWLVYQVLRQRKDVDAGLKSNYSAHLWEGELLANRISIAWWREHDPEYLARMMENFRMIQKRSVSPVPPGRSPEEYFNGDYASAGKFDSASYGWFQMDMTLFAYDQRPILTFAQTIEGLPKENFEAVRSRN
jgi:hypothetical protein